MGCALSGPAFPHAQTTTTVQFDREIVHVLDNHCVVCHSQKGLAFPLVTYEQTYGARWKIRQDVLDRHMAPWAAVPGYGEFVNDNGLTQREIDFLVSWAESFGPRNNGEVYTGLATARAPVQAHFDGRRWMLGNPDLQLTLPANTVAAKQADQVQRVSLDPRLTRDRWLRGLEYKPADGRVVHAVSVTIQESGAWLGSWTPWHPYFELPAGLAYRLPAGSHLLLKIHSYGSSEPVTEHASLGLYFAAQPSLRTVASIELNARSAAGSPRKWLGTRTLEEDTGILALEPEIHAGIQSIEVSARKPDGTKQILLFARSIPLEWPTPYVLRKPVSLEKGTQLSVIEHYLEDAATPTGGFQVTFSAYSGGSLTNDEPQTSRAGSSTQRFKLTGTVLSVDASNGRLTVQHQAIQGYMGAMTMAYRVGKRQDLQRLQARDEIRCDVVVSDSGGAYLENIEVLVHGR
jgi:Cu/Ag efflux protein CusF/cytochrome c5